MRRPLAARLGRVLVPVVTVVTMLTMAASASASVRGLDIASWQHPKGRTINWPAVRSTGQTFVFIKATEGRRYRNPWFANDWRGSASAGLLHGGYHFARPSRGTAAAQARHYVRAVGHLHAPGALPPVLDLETTGGLRPHALIRWTAQWLSKVRHKTGRRPIIYSYPGFWRTAMRGTSRFHAYPLWGACYCHRPTTFGGAWRHWTFWQFTSRSRVAGVRGRIDMNAFNGSRARLRTLAHVGSRRHRAAG